MQPTATEQTSDPPRAPDRRVRRRVATVAALAAVVIGLAWRALFSGWLAKYGGVALWATLVYLLIVWLRPGLSARRAGLACIIISVAVELFQLTPIPRALYELHRGFALVFGTTFNLYDLPAYAAGALLGVALHSAYLRRQRAR